MFKNFIYLTRMYVPRSLTLGILFYFIVYIYNVFEKKKKSFLIVHVSKKKFDISSVNQMEVPNTYKYPKYL